MIETAEYNIILTKLYDTADEDIAKLVPIIGYPGKYQGYWNNTSLAWWMAKHPSWKFMLELL